MANGIPHAFPSGLVELLRQRIPIYASLSKRHQYNIGRMLWDYANNRYQHLIYDGAAFSVEYMESLWGNLRTRNQVVKEFFSNIQGDNISQLISDFNPHSFLGLALVDFLEDDTPIDLLDGEKRMRMPLNPILSRAANNDKEVTFAKHSIWKGIRPSPTIPINQVALLEFSRKTTDPREKMSALRLLKLSRNRRCPGSIPVLYEQKSTGRLTEVLFAIQNNQREVISAALHGYWDYDLNNAHFSILSAWAKRLGQSTPVVDEYLSNRREIRSVLTEHCKSKPEHIKECLIALLYGAPLQTNPDFAEIPKILGKEASVLFTTHPFVKNLKKEITKVGKNIVDDTYTLRGCYVNAMGIEAPKHKKQTTFNLLCHALQGVEALALKCVIAHYGEDILLCMHDGWVSRHRLDCDQLKNLIKSATGFKLEIEEKQLPKYQPTSEGDPAWRFADSTPVTGGFYISASSNWNTPNNVKGRNTRTDLNMETKKYPIK